MEETKSLDSLQVISGLLLISFSIFGVIIPVIGFSYDYGYLSIFGLDSNIFPRSLWDLWKHSVDEILNLTTQMMQQLPPIFWGLLILMLLYLLLFIAIIVLDRFNKFRSLLNREHKKPIKLSKAAKEITDKLDIKPEYVFPLIIAPGVFLLAISLLVIKPALDGIKAAKETITKYKDSGCGSVGWSNCIVYSNPNDVQAKVYSGFLVAASSTHIAILDNSGVSVIPRTPEYVLARQLIVNADRVKPEIE